MNSESCNENLSPVRRGPGRFTRTLQVYATGNQQMTHRKMAPEMATTRTTYVWIVNRTALRSRRLFRKGENVIAIPMIDEDV